MAPPSENLDLLPRRNDGMLMILFATLLRLIFGITSLCDNVPLLESTAVSIESPKYTSLLLEGQPAAMIKTVPQSG